MAADLELREDARAPGDDPDDLDEAAHVYLPQVANAVLDWKTRDAHLGDQIKVKHKGGDIGERPLEAARLSS